MTTDLLQAPAANVLADEHFHELSKGLERVTRLPREAVHAAFADADDGAPVAGVLAAALASYGVLPQDLEGVIEAVRAAGAREAEGRIEMATRELELAGADLAAWNAFIDNEVRTRR